jgi:hypothetical protein
MFGIIYFDYGILHRNLLRFLLIFSANLGFELGVFWLNYLARENKIKHTCFEF